MFSKQYFQFKKLGLPFGSQIQAWLCRLVVVILMMFDGCALRWPVVDVVQKYTFWCSAIKNQNRLNLILKQLQTFINLTLYMHIFYKYPFHDLMFSLCQAAAHV